MQRKGRGALSNPSGRFETHAYTDFDDGWEAAERLPPLATTVEVDSAKTLISRNQSPDIPFEQSVNPYRGCEHGCIYCYARANYPFYGLSPGLDFETRLFYKPNAAQLLKNELSHPRYQCTPIALGNVTDAYQPIERKLEITRQLLQVMHEFNQPFTVVTKSALIERDIGLLAALAGKNLVQVMFSITTLDKSLARLLEPRATAPHRRLTAMRCLHEAGIPVGVMFAPVIPYLNDGELESVFTAAAEHGAEAAGYVLLRLPHELEALFSEWLATHFPLKTQHVLSLLAGMHNGHTYQAEFGKRMRGSGAYADMLAQRSRLICRKLGLNKMRRDLNCQAFKVPARLAQQLALF